MKQKCIRCVVQIDLAEVQWQDSSGVDILLEGPSLFVRACVLGQLQHTHLHTPSFPVRINQTLTFDRVLTNCRDPSLFKEVIRGEHVKFELIQISDDFKGGKILARFDTPAHKFLFPDISSGELQELVMNKSRKYPHPPKLTYTCSTSLLEATVQSPVDSIFKEESILTQSVEDSQSGHGLQKMKKDDDRDMKEKLTLSALGKGTTKPTAHSNRTGVSLVERSGVTTKRSCDDGDQLESDDARHKLHSLLESYLEPSKTLPRETKTPYRVKFKPPVPKFPKHPPSKTALQHTHTPLPVKDTDTSVPTTPTHLFHSTASRVGPHEWEACPRRSPKRPRSYSAPNSPSRHSRRNKHTRTNTDCTRPSPTYLDQSLAMSDLEEADIEDTRPPFVVRHTDPQLLKRRDFCGCSQGRSQMYQSLDVGEDFAESSCDDDILSVRRSGFRDDFRLERDLPLYLNENLRMSNEDYTSSGRLSSRVQSSHMHSSLPSHTDILDTTSPQSSTTGLTSRAHSLSSRGVSTAPRANRSSYSSHRGANDLVSKYLVSQPGNLRRGAESPYTVIGEKIEKLKNECCDCKHEADSLGEDELSEDLDRLKASLQAERDEYLSQTGKLLPDENVTVKIGPRDYWSRRMSEFTGKRHRLLFDETLEKIYNRLYTDASKST